MTRLQKLQQKKTRTVVGLMSGTSVDGIDAVVVRISGNGTKTRIRQIAFETYDYPPGYRKHVLENSQPGQGTVDAICALNILSANMFADAVRRITRKARLKLSNIDLVGSHGQTVHHIPEGKNLFGKRVRSTLQIGDPSTIATLTGISTVGDFRTADMAAGGQGAPLVSYLDFLLFRSSRENRILLNLGGIANITALPKNCSLEEVSAFDTGPANMIIDTLARTLFNKPYDSDGNLARSGHVNQQLLHWMLGHVYFKVPPPKSTGREVFGESYVKKLLAKAGRLGKRDIMATATAFTAESIVHQYRAFVKPRMKVNKVICSGGGSYNKTLMAFLRKLFAPAPVIGSDTVGISSDAKEAILFAVLANETISENPSNVPHATGAERPVILGKICL